jgi:hypothetical protein
MDCSTVDVSVDDYCTVLSKITPKARKQHKCHECRRIINIGERYEKVTEVFEGEISTHKTCTSCLSIREVFFSDGYYFGQIIEAMEEHVFECDGDISEKQILKLDPDAKKIIADIIEEYLSNDYDIL